jgi:hypothetical protein
MKKLVISIMALAVCVLVPANRASGAIQDGLISCWAFDEGSGTVAADIVGDNNGVLLKGLGTGIAPQWVVGGKFGKALQFDGVSAYVDCGNPASLKPAVVSVAAWIKVDAYSYYGQIAGFGTDTGSRECGYALMTDDYYIGGADSIALWISGGGTPTSTDGNYWANTNVPTEPTGWVHCAGTYDGTNMIVYVNGVAGTPSPVESGNINYTWGEHFLIGVYWTPIPGQTQWWLPYAGLIDDVGVWDRALSAGEVAWLGAGAGRAVIDPLWIINPTPANKATLVPLAQVLSWTQPLAGTQTGYDVYFGTNPFSTDPNVGVNPKVIDNLLVTSYDPPGDMPYNTQYYWRVNIHAPIFDPNVLNGPRWNFTTRPETPAVTQDPQSVVVAAGGTAVFTVQGEFQISYQWYKSTDAANNTPGDDTTVGGNSNTLTINNVQLANEGYYYCKLTNGAGSTSSNVAKLMTKRMVGWWKMDDNYNDSSPNPNPAPVNGTPVGDPEFVPGLVGTKAVDLDGDDYIRIDAAADNLRGSNNVTLSGWVKTDDALADWFSCNTSTGGNVAMFAIESGLAAIYDVSAYEAYSTTAVSDSNWHLLTYTRDGATGSVYVDGVRENTHTANYNFSPNDLWSIGQEWDTTTPSDFLRGQVDDVQMYNYALSASDVAKLYTDVKGGSVCMEYDERDFNKDCKVNLKDLATFVSQWLDCNLIPATACPP